MPEGIDEDWKDAVAAHKARYRRRIVDAAVELAGQEGVAALTMAGLAQRAGIGRATLYKYFPDVEHVLLAHVENEIGGFAAHLDEVLATEPEPVRRLRAYVEATLGYLAGEGHRAGSTPFAAGGLSPAVEATLLEHLATLHQPLETLLAEGVAAGVFRAGLDPALHAGLVFAVLGGLRQPLIDGDLTAEEGIAVAWDLLMDGLTRAGPGGRSGD